MTPPDPPGETGLVAPADPVDVGQTTSYACQRGSRMSTDPAVSTVDAECLTGNVWDLPDPWPQCVESKRWRLITNCRIKN